MHILGQYHMLTENRCLMRVCVAEMISFNCSWKREVQIVHVYCDAIECRRRFFLRQNKLLLVEQLRKNNLYKQYVKCCCN